MAADGNIKIDITIDGDDIKTSREQVKGLGEDAKGVKPGTDTANKGIKEMVVSLGLVKIGAAAFKVLAQSMDAAISRFDTFQTFPKVMDALGESVEDSKKGIDKLSAGIDGLPTKLDDIVSVTQRMYTSFNNLDDATDTALALNNALLASAAGAADAQRGTDQYIQGLQKGKFELEEWKTLQETMGTGLLLIAESFGMTERELKAALDSGAVSMDDFNNRMIELGTGTGELASLAKENSVGIGTSLINLGNTASRGLADIIAAFDDLAKEVTGSTIAEHIDNMKVIINAAFKVISNSIKALAPVVILLADGFGLVTRAAQVLSPILYGLAAAYAALLIIQKVQAAIATSRAAFEGMATTIQKITVLTQSKTLAELANSKVQATYLAANLASLKALTAKNIIIGLLTGQLKLSTAATLLKAKAVTILSGVLKALSGPVGWVVAGIGGLVAGGIALVKWLNKSTAEGERLTKQTDELAESTEELTSDLEANQKGYEKQIRQSEASSRANGDLANKIAELSAIENKSAEQKKLLGDYVEQLNGQVDGLNLAYDEEADAMNMSGEQLEKRIELMKEQEAATAGQERLLEISKEQNEIDLQLEKTNELREEWNQKMEDGSVKSKEYKAAIKELDEQEATLKETNAELGEQAKITEEQMMTAMENVTEISEESIGKQIVLYDSLSDGQKAAVDEMRNTWTSYQEAATDMFDTLSEKSEISVAEMTANMEENQRVISNWSDNIAALAERGIDEGLLEELRKAGPESAGHVQAMVNASDDELEKLSSTFAEGGNVATDALSTSLGEGAEDALAEVGHLVTGLEETLKSKIDGANFPALGGDVTDGMAKGIEIGKKEAINASGEMADDMIEKTQQTLQTHSPSKVFTDIGTDTTDGLALGVSNGTSEVIDAAQKVASEMPRPFDNISRDFRGIGQQAMNGLVWGLNNGRGRVMATARSIANSVASTMQAALKIKSPSGVFRDDIGRWIPEGVADGIDANADSVYKSIREMANNMVNVPTPELALLGGNINGHNFTSQVSHNNNYDDSDVISLLRRIADKDINSYLDGELITDKVGKRQQQKVKGKGRKYNL